MNLIIEIRWFRDYHGRTATDERAPVEWPPSPWRLFCAMLNACKPETEAEIPASVRWLAELPAPLLITPPVGEETSEPPHTIPLNDIYSNEPWRDGENSRGHLVKVRRDFRLPLLGDKTARFIWKAIPEPPPGTIEELDFLLLKVPYLGVAEDSCSASVYLAARKEPAFPDSTFWIPNSGIGVALPTASASTLKNLVRFHHSGRRQVARFREINPPRIVYRRRDDPPGLFEVFRFEDAKGAYVSFDPRDACAIAENVRAALLTALKNTGVDCPFLHGHHERGRGHVQIFPLPSLGHMQADGKIRRVALVGTPEATEIDDVQIAMKELAFAKLPGTQATLIPESVRNGVVQALCGGELDLATVTPIVLPNPELRGRDGDSWRNRKNLPPADRLRLELKRKDSLHKIILRLLNSSGIFPTEIQIQNPSFGRQIPPASAFRIPGSRQSYLQHSRVHVRIQLPKAHACPLAIGPGRFFGLGLLAPFRALKIETSPP